VRTFLFVQGSIADRYELADNTMFCAVGFNN